MRTVNFALLVLCIFLLSACGKKSVQLVEACESVSTALSARQDFSDISFVGPPEPEEKKQNRQEARNQSRPGQRNPRFIDDRYGSGKLGPRVLFHDIEVSAVEPIRISLTLDSVWQIETDAKNERTTFPRKPRLVRVFSMHDARQVKRAGDALRAHSEKMQNMVLQLPPPPEPPAPVNLFRSWIPRNLSLPWSEWESIIVDAGHDFGLDPVFIAAMIKAESNFDHKAVSHAGAQGAMQIMPGTQRDLGLSDPFDARANVYAGCRFIRSLLLKYRSTELALAAYNAGPFAVAKAGGIPPYKETLGFIQRILRLWLRTT